MNYPNFYESINEMQIRLRSTVVLYENDPWYVIAITDHMKDGKFRIYMVPLMYDGKKPKLPEYLDSHQAGGNELGKYLDQWMKDHPGRIERKYADSPGFNKFRPFPLGMCGHGNAVFYLERQPNRVTQQGLLRSMVHETRVDCGFVSNATKKQSTVDFFSQDFIDCVKGDYNSPKECLRVLLDTTNYDYEAAAFHRDFALVQGPCEMLFLGYKDDIIGSLPKLDFSTLKLGRNFRHCREVVEELNLFYDII